MQRHVGSAFSAVKTSQIRNLNGANGMNTPRWEAGGWTALVGGNPTERIGRSRVSDMAGNAARVAVECGERCRDTNLKSYIRHPVQKQGRSVPNQRPGRRRGQAERLRTDIRPLTSEFCLRASARLKI